ncbi:UNVERIFIED_CONTAM: Glucan endo-1,3-beta-glucosidase 14 [Sesamum latifolium]|uniref:Glucan endo-1,3-beta-glucosidase 14 n=1 Tax=Sesamum latifolium TaxID=2727402 RepID=A0AAW2Y4V5_9LAMI
MSIRSLGVGINYGQIANNLPSPSRVAYLLGSLNISRVKLYDADPNVLTAFANSDVEFVVGLGNEYLQKMTDPNQAQAWIQQHVQPYISQTKIKCITVGNEEIYVTTAHSTGILGNSFPPSAGAFRQDLAVYLQSILNFHAQTNSPFLINAYPFFAYKDNPDQISLSYVLFQPNPGTVDPITNLHYDNMLYAQIDSVYSAIKAMGHTNIQVKVSETEQNQGTPAKPSIPIDIFVFALFNEDLKPGPTSERNYGLYYPDGTPVYNIGLQGYLPRMDYSASEKNVIFFFSFLLPVAFLICTL